MNDAGTPLACFSQVIWDKAVIARKILYTSPVLGPDGRPTLTIYVNPNAKQNSWLLHDAHNWA